MPFHLLHQATARRRRLAKFGLSPADHLPVADLRLRVACTRSECAPIAAAITQGVKGYRRAHDKRFLWFFKNTAAVTDLSLFTTPDAYLRAVSRETAGKYHRSANKAKRGGYFIRRIGIGSFAQSLFDIRASKDRRSHGQMPEAAGALARPERDQDVPPSAPNCPEHWRMDWGLFNRSDARMWGFASLLRSGNVVQLDHMIAHADALAAGGMKLMQVDLMAWLLERTDPIVTGIEYLLHGAIEHGGEGAADWRRYVQQHPHALQLTNAEYSRTPSDFDPAVYLALNPDVRAAGTNPREHYLRHGMIEGRTYKVPPTNAEP